MARRPDAPFLPLTIARDLRAYEPTADAYKTAVAAGADHVKRGLDVVLASLALVVALPVMLAIAAAIVLTSRGPIFFAQPRCGLNGRVFRMLKFRTMVKDAPALRPKLEAVARMRGPIFKMPDDPRITRLGRLLRKHGLDEVPQLINVLRGDMSIVGPRPPLPSEVAQYRPGDYERLSVRPGLTCLWQVSGPDRNRISFDEWMAMDREYIKRRSLWLDLKIMLATVPAVVRGTGW